MVTDNSKHNTGLHGNSSVRNIAFNPPPSPLVFAWKSLNKMFQIDILKCQERQPFKTECSALNKNVEMLHFDIFRLKFLFWITFDSASMFDAC